MYMLRDSCKDTTIGLRGNNVAADNISEAMCDVAFPLRKTPEPLRFEVFKKEVTLKKQVIPAKAGISDR
jgi:hypothetical protein